MKITDADRAIASEVWGEPLDAVSLTSLAWAAAQLRERSVPRSVALDVLSAAFVAAKLQYDR